MIMTAISKFSKRKITSLAILAKHPMLDVWQGFEYTSEHDKCLNLLPPQATIICSKLTIKTLEQRIKYVQS